MHKKFAFRPSLAALALGAVLAALTCSPLGAQQSALVAGTVLDPSGKSLPDATVSVRSESGGAVRDTKTDREGRFEVRDLGAGVYDIDVTASGFAPASRPGVKVAVGTNEELSFTLNVSGVSQSVTISETVSLAALNAPSLSSLEAVGPESVINPTFIQNFMSPTGDYSDIVQMSPGTFSVSSNGPGLGDTKIFFRGFKDGFYNMTFDGLPFNDTNDPTHHSWTFFPTQFIGSTQFDRSPGDATAIGPSNSGGSVNLYSKEMADSQNFRFSSTYASFNTRLQSLDYESGPFGGPKKRLNVILNVNNLASDGYQTYNYQSRWGGSAKVQYKISDKTVITAFTGIIQLNSNTPNIKGPTRAQVAQFGDNYLLNNDPASAFYYKYSWYHIPTDFDYIGIKSELGRGWRFEDKFYSDYYYNHQQYNGSTITAISATDKLNSYRKFGNSLNLIQDSARGTFRTGIWYEVAYTDRFQTPTDPRTWVDAKTPNFHEKFITQSLQPFGQYEYRVTSRLSLMAGIKFTDFSQHLNQFSDNGKTIGCVGGTLTKDPVTGATICNTSIAFISHRANYTKWLPNASARYHLKNNWSAYFQYAMGDVIPPSSVFDVAKATVLSVPKPTTTTAYQFGSVARWNRVTLDIDAFFIRAQNAYTSFVDAATGEPVYVLGNDTLTKGIEAESNVAIGHGFNLYLNGTFNSAKYDHIDRWVASAPKDTETIALTYMHKNWDVGFFNKRVGDIWNDNGAINQAVPINPFLITNVFFNYTVKGDSRWRGTKFRFGVNNIQDSHAITAIAASVAATAAVPYVASPGDTLTMLAGRSISGGVTFGWAPKK